jgi:putative nucleotidyltransferase with HDIG domain
MREELLQVVPEINWVEDEALREGVIRTYLRALREGGFGPYDMERMPFTLAKKTTISYADHVRVVTKIARAAYDTFQEVFGEQVPLDREVLLAGALLHDVGKLLEMEERQGKFQKSAGGKVLRHPFSGVGLAYAEGLPPEVLHIIAVHSKEGDPSPRTPEGVIVHHADFITFDTIT